MSDPRNAAHDKKVSQEKKHQETSEAAHEPAASAEAAAAPAAAETTEASKAPPAALEGSLVVLAQLKDMDFHSRATLERLAEMMLTVDDQLKQKAFASTIGDIFSIQDKFQNTLVKLIEDYKAECDHMQSGDE